MIEKRLLFTIGQLYDMLTSSPATLVNDDNVISNILGDYTFFTFYKIEYDVMRQPGKNSFA